jgi:cytochrome c oxidase subunit 4
MEEQHENPRRTYFLVYLGLLLLLALTVGAAFVDLSWLNPILAVSIAFVKALLVLLFFMHLRGSSNLTRLFVMMGIVWFLILIGLTFTDYITRIRLPD